MEALTVIQALRRAFPEATLTEIKALTHEERHELAEQAATEMGFALVPATASSNITVLQKAT